MKADYFGDLFPGSERKHADVPGVPGSHRGHRGRRKARHDNGVPGVPGVPGNKNTNQLAGDMEREDENAREYFEERAAIGEYDGGLSRHEAEKQAARHVYEYRLTNNEAPWLILLTPCETVEQATESLKDRYGAERVIAVRRKQITKMETEK